MANKKNKNNKSKSTHSYVFKRRPLPPWLVKKNDKKVSNESIQGKVAELSTLKLCEYTDQLNAHSSPAMVLSD